jgi:hypothetical protein
LLERGNEHDGCSHYLLRKISPESLWRRTDVVDETLPSFNRVFLYERWLENLTLLASDLQVDVEYVRNGKLLTTSMFRMSVRRVQSIRDWMEVQSKNASHAMAQADYLASQYSREMLEGMIMIVVEQHQCQDMMLERIGQVCHMGTPLIVDLSANVLPLPICSISEDAATLTILCVAAQRSQRNAQRWCTRTAGSR